jgi:hypothetical protein
MASNALEAGKATEPRAGSQFPILTDKDAIIPFAQRCPEYKDDEFARWRTATIYIDPDYMTPHYKRISLVDEATYEYDDKIWSRFEQEDARLALIQASERLKLEREDTPREYEEWLKILYSEPNLKLVHIYVARKKSEQDTYLAFGIIHNQELWLSDDLSSNY